MIPDDEIGRLRVTRLNDKPVDEAGDCVIYWMQRSHRLADNPALNHAIGLANQLGKPVLVYFGLFDRYPMASLRAFQFMLEGLFEVAGGCAARGLGFVIRREDPCEGVASVAEETNACAVVVDEDYLRLGRKWRSDAAARLPVPLTQIDSDTVVPVRFSGKEEWGAYTLRPKIRKILDQCLVAMPALLRPVHTWTGGLPAGLDLAAHSPAQLAESLDTDQSVLPVPGVKGGFSEAARRLEEFIESKLPDYADKHSEIGEDITSGLSPYLHFGQISPLTVALIVMDSDAPRESIDAFIEQLIVRRELAINFCFHNPQYDDISAAPDWARRTLDAHRLDPRPELYSLEELEAGQTHDELWNAAQGELVQRGVIHNYMRMLWAKKILEWSPTPEDALARAIYLNDKYALDGRDPNGYANIAWCIMGKHDRPFADRAVFGKIRCMTSESTKRKMRWRDYLKRVV